VYKAPRTEYYIYIRKKQLENHTRFRLLEQVILAQRLVADIPESYFEDPTTTFIDPAMGGGQYLTEIVKRCEKYHSREQILPRLYGAETRQMFITRAKRYNKLQGVNFTLDLKDFEGMQFDVVIGNPPYQDSSTSNKRHKLWPQFIKKSIELLKPGGFLSLITPISWATFDTKITAAQRKVVLDSIDVQKIKDCNQFFSVGVDIAQWSGAKRKYSGNTEIMGEKHNFNDGAWYYPEQRQRVPIHNKVLSFHTHLPIKESNHISAKQCVGGSTPIYVSGTKLLHTDLQVNDAGMAKLVAPFSSSPWKRFHTTEAVGMFNPMMPCTEEEFSVLTKIWDLKVVRFFLMTWSKTAGFTPGVFSIPDLRGMNDEEAYGALGLTEDEIALVEDYCS